MPPSNQPFIFAHRGASAHAPENTLAAFCMAVDLGANGIELDAKLSADQQVMVIHDQTVDRTTDGKGKVRELTLQQLKSLDAGSFFDSQFAQERIPTLEEVFAEVGQRTVINVELTNYASPTDPLPELVADLVIKYSLQGRVLFSSFLPMNLIRIHRRLPQVPAAILTLEGNAGWLMRGMIGRLAAPQYIHPYYTDVTAELMTAEHRRGRRVNAWTVDDPNEMKRLFNLQIDGIITDDPRLARQVLEGK